MPSKACSTGSVKISWKALACCCRRAFCSADCPRAHRSWRDAAPPRCPSCRAPAGTASRPRDRATASPRSALLQRVFLVLQGDEERQLLRAGGLALGEGELGVGFEPRVQALVPAWTLSISATRWRSSSLSCRSQSVAAWTPPSPDAVPVVSLGAPIGLAPEPAPEAASAFMAASSCSRCALSAANFCSSAAIWAVRCPVIDAVRSPAASSAWSAVSLGCGPCLSHRRDCPASRDW